MDIDYLRDIGKVDNFPLSIDSSMRDKRAFPTPGEYEIAFDTPFTNVVGFDVLDATIPNTVYSVDAHNQRLSFVINVRSATAPSAPVTEYLSGLAAGGDFAAVWADTRYPSLQVKLVGALLTVPDMDLAADPQPDTPLVLTRTTVALQAYNYRGDAGGEPPDVVPVDYNTEYELSTDGVDYFISEFTSGGLARGFGLLKRIRTVEVAGKRSIVVSATSPGGRVLYATAAAADLLDKPTIGNRQRMHFPRFQAGALVAIDAFGMFRVTRDYYLGLEAFEHELELHNLTVDPGDHDEDSLVRAIELAMPTYLPAPAGSPAKLIGLHSTSLLGDPDNPSYQLQRKIRFESVFPFWLDMEKSTIRSVIGFGDDASDAAPGYTPYRIGANRSVFQADPFNTETNNLYRMDSPGVISLVSERMVVLRCPQIEDHAFPSISHGKFSAGLGVFKLYDQMYSHLRFDFIKLARLDFHPIGKLSKLRLRFECLNGSIYDFKGVDHHLFISVKFMIPRVDRMLPPPQNRLNPDYDPNIMRYVVRHDLERDETDTESDEEILRDGRHAARYHENRRRFMLAEEMNKHRLELAAMAPGGDSSGDSGGDSGDPEGGEETGTESGSDSP
eukprot:jgi/Tetstr1/454125/TSEL_041044.t1